MEFKNPPIPTILVSTTLEDTVSTQVLREFARIFLEKQEAAEKNEATLGFEMHVKIYQPGELKDAPEFEAKHTHAWALYDDHSIYNNGFVKVRRSFRSTTKYREPHGMPPWTNAMFGTAINPKRMTQNEKGPKRIIDCAHQLFTFSSRLVSLPKGKFPWGDGANRREEVDKLHNSLNPSVSTY